MASDTPNDRKSKDDKQERLRLVHKGTPLDPPVIQDTLTDPGLTAVIDAWDGQPEAVRASIVMLVKAAARGDGR